MNAATIEWVVAVLLIPGVAALVVLAYRSGALVKMLEMIGLQLQEMKQTDRDHTKRLERHEIRLVEIETRHSARHPHRVEDEPSGPDA